MSAGIEIIIILLLVLANGVFAMAEIALVSSRKSRLQKRLDDGDKRAGVVMELTGSPNRFFSTIQFGITLVGVGAGAFGGATVAKQIAEWVGTLPYVGVYADTIGITVVVLGITILSMVFGELVPKRIALNYPEKISLFMARPIDWLSRVAGPLVSFLGAVTDGALKLLGIREVKEPSVSEEDVKLLVRQGLLAGVIQKTEKEMVEGVLDLDRLNVGDIMTPRANIVWLNVRDPDELNWRKIVASGHTHFPVYDTNRDNVLGMVSIKALWANLSLANRAELKTLISEPEFVPGSMSAIKLLELFKQTGRHVALVADEFGGVEGLVSLQDVLEAIVGEMPSKDQPKRFQAKKRDDGSWLIDAMLEIDEFKKIFGFKELPGEAEEEYQTVGGFAIHRFGRIPVEGDKFEFGGYTFEVIDMDRHKLDKILLTPVKK